MQTTISATHLTSLKICQAEAEANRIWRDLGGKENNWIDHTDQDGTPRRDQLTLSAAVMFALEAKNERITKAEAEIAKGRTATEFMLMADKNRFARVLELEAEIAALRWIPVSERLPECGIGFVRVVRETMMQPVLDFAVHEDGHWLRFRCAENGAPWELVQCNVTHWMPLPAAPEDDK
jgi:hypothetical protein